MYVCMYVCRVKARRPDLIADVRGWGLMSGVEVSRFVCTRVGYSNLLLNLSAGVYSPTNLPIHLPLSHLCHLLE